MSSLHFIDDLYTQNSIAPIVQVLQHQLSLRGYRFFCVGSWTLGICVNELANLEAKAGCHYRHFTSQVIASSLRQWARDEWAKVWQEKQNNLLKR